MLRISILVRSHLVCIRIPAVAYPVLNEYRKECRVCTTDIDYAFEEATFYNPVLYTPTDGEQGWTPTQY